MTYAAPGIADFNLPEDVYEYDSNATTVLRRTHTDYNVISTYVNRRIIGLASRRTLYDGAGVLASKVEYIYDEAGSVQAHSATPVRHDTANYGTGFVAGRGNLTTVRRYDVNDNSYVENKTGYYLTGTVAYAKDALNHLTTFNYNGAFYNSSVTNRFAFPTTITDPDGFASTVQYDYNNNAAALTTNPKGASVLRQYDAYDRLFRVTNQVNGAYTRYEFDSNQYYVKSYSTIQEGQGEFYSITVFDGHDRVRATVSDHPGSVGLYKGVYNAYDTMGRPWQQSNPTEINGSWVPSGDDSAWWWTVQSYDWNGRPEVTTNTNGTTKSVSYGGCGCAGSNAMTITDESGRQKKVIYDVLGRVRKTQVLNSGGNVYSTQVNTWNVRDQVTYSRQYSGDPADVSTCPSNACLETAMLYDGHGRKASNKRPDESMATSYEYHDDDTLKKVTDARGAYASFTYWGRPLVKDITYNKPSGVGDTNSVYFEYDGASNRTLMIEKVPNTDPDPNQRCGPSRECGRTTYSYDQQSRMQWELRTFYGLSGSYKLTYDYNLSGQLKQLGYESSNFAMDNNTIYYGHDKAGNLTSVTGTPFAGVTTYAAGMQYRAWGAVKSLSYGNGITFSANYNKRLQMQTFEIAKTGSPTMMKADFQYYGDGRIKYAKDYRDDRFDRAFSYDQVGRIQEAYAGSQARGFMGLPDPNPATPPYRQSYQYDVWGNTTGSSGKFWSRDYTSTDSYNPNGQRQGWQYDGAGNLLNDSRNQYIYDAAGRNISVTANGQNPKAQSLDGDGLVIRQVNYTQLPNPACYYLRSTVLGGVTVIKINGTDNGPGFLSVGRVTGETIYAGDAEIATQTTYANGSISLSWTHLNPVTNSKGHSFASGEYFTDIEPDPTGAYLGLTEPVSNPDPPPSGGEGIPLFLLPTGGDPWVKVTVDGVEVPWAEAQRLIGMGIATRAPENLFAPVVWHGERTLAKWQSFADGYQGYVPIGACYGGDGVLTRCGNGKPQLYRSYHSGLRDNVAAINGATGEAELGYSLSFGLQQGGGPRSQTQSQTPTPQGNCATPNSLINDPEHKKLFEALWDRTMASGEENGAAIFYESVTNTYHKIKLSEGEHMKVLSTDKQRVVYEVPTMPNAGREMKAALNNFAAEKRDVLFMAFFHTHPNYKLMLRGERSW